MKLVVDLRKESVKRLEDMRKTVESVGIIEQGFSPYFLDLFHSYCKEVEKREKELC